MKELDIQHVLAVGTPRANGQVERMNRFIVPMIAKIMTDISKWDNTIQSVEYAVNNTVSRSTNSIPSKLLFGINQNNCCDKIREALEESLEQERDLLAMRQQASNAIETL